MDRLSLVHWYCRKGHAIARKLLKANGLKSIIEKLNTLIQTNVQYETRLLATDSKVNNRLTQAALPSSAF